MPILIGLSLIIIVFIGFSKSRDKNAKKNSEEFWKKERESKFVPRKDISALDYITVPYSSLPFRHYMPGPASPVRIAKEGVTETTPTDFTDHTGEFSVTTESSDKLHAVDELLSELSSDTDVSGIRSFPNSSEYSAPLSEELAEVESEICKLSNSKILNLTGVSNTELRLTYGTANLDPLMSYDHNFTQLIRSLQKWGSLLASAGHPEDAVTVLSYAVSIGSDIAGTYAVLARLYKSRGELGKIEELKTRAEELTTLMKPSILRDLEQLLQTP
ncbi:MAG: hypothetical protein IKT67_09705 [Lachnospiraceae bacterium]|nr:hypothetical protein [Lachnospiraceae bacterium]